MPPSNGNGNGNGNSPTFKWVAGILLSLLFVTSGVIAESNRQSIKEAQDLAKTNYAMNKAQIDCLSKEKLDKEQYYRDMTDIKETLRSINVKLDHMREKNR